MNDELRFKLFREIAGYNEITTCRHYSESLKNSEAYKIISYNIVEARKSKTRKAKSLVFAYDNLNFNVNSVKDIFKLEISINYMALHSFPCYYLNPLAIGPNYIGEINSIGDLYIDFKGKEKSINDIILDDENSLDIKYEQIKNYVNYCQGDMNDIINESLARLKNTNFSKTENKTDIILGVIEDIFFIIFNFTAFFFLIYPFKDYQALITSFSFSKITSILLILFPLITFLYDLSFIIFHSYKAKIMEPFNYAKRFLKQNEFKIYQDVKNRGEKLYNYLCGAIKARITLKNDITQFSMLSSSFIDYKAILDVENQKKKTLYKSLRNILFSFTLLELAIFILQIIVYIVDIIFSTII